MRKLSGTGKALLTDLLHDRPYQFRHSHADGIPPPQSTPAVYSSSALERSCVCPRSFGNPEDRHWGA